MFGVEIQRATTRHGRLFCARRDSVIAESLRRYGEWAQVEIETLAALAEDDGVILDVGANIGTHALGFAALKPHSTIIALEPQPLAHALLAANVLAAGAGTVQPLNLAAGARRKVVMFQPDYEALGWNVGAVNLSKMADPLDTASGTTPVLVWPLDELNIDRPVTLIKIDVEGMEPEVLEGGRDLIGRHRPVIYFEVLTMEALMACRRILTGMDYDLRWLETPAFNPDNFLGEAENIWSLGEVGVLAMPTADDVRIAPLPRVTGDEAEPPRGLFARTCAD